MSAPRNTRQRALLATRLTAQLTAQPQTQSHPQLSRFVVLAAAALTLLASTRLAAQQQPDYADAMMREHAHEVATASPAARVAPRSAVVGDMVQYATVNGKVITGYLAKPAAMSGAGKPAIVMVHEWWGLNDQIKAVADRYAGEGYMVLAVDLFGRVATTPDSAMVMYQAAMADVASGEQNVQGAITFLKQNGATSIGTVGYCFGGHWSLRTGLVGGSDVQAVVMYYGAPITNTQEIARLEAPVLGLFGGLDRGIPVDSVRAMEQVMQTAGREVDITVYDNANHAFANPTGQAYNASAAADAWQKSLGFFKAKLK